jgi:6-phosphogluconolactonase
VSASVVVHPDKDTLAAAVAARLVTAVVDAQAARGRADLVLTGGTVGIAVLAAVRDSPARAAVDWGRVHLWWGDERFLPSGDADRNETQARAALLDAVPLPAGHVHAMPPSDGPDGDDPEAAARRYARELAAAEGAGDAVAVPPFDVVLLGVGPDAHVASLFPGHPAAREAGTSVVAVRDSPKPPPVRTSLTFPAIARAEQVWLVVAGDDKAEAVAAARTGADPARSPASAVRGSKRTLWLLDRAAASRL